MRFFTSVILCFVVCCSIHAQAGTAGDVTVNPNAPGAQAAKLEPEKDSRMARKITYDGGYKRLHVVVDDLRRMTGVNILCGRNDKDWNVRDIPVVVYVKDLPLEKLLRAIAGATHTTFASERIDGSSGIRYRIYRRSVDQDNLYTYMQKRYDYSLADAAWQWDVVEAYGKSTENPPADRSLRDTWLMARMIAGLGSDSKSRLLNGDTFTFRGTDPANRAYMEEYYQYVCERIFDPAGLSYPPFEEVDDTPLNVKLVDNGTEAEIHVMLGPLLLSRITLPDGQELLGPVRLTRCDPPNAGLLQGKVTGIPSRPKATPIPNPKDDIDNPELVLLSGHESTDIKSDSFVMAKIILEKPTTAKDFTFAKAVRAIAQAGQCNIVTEDFISHKAQKYQGIDGIFNPPAETTILKMLSTLDGSTWFASKDDRLIVGWQNGRRQTWRDHHANMLPEEYLSNLKEKLNNDGLNLEDAIHLSSLPKPSTIEWVFLTDDLSNLYQGNPDPAWRLYDALKPGDKQLAKSEGGLPLGKFDSTWIADFFHAGRLTQIPSPELGPDAEAHSGNIKQNNLALADPAIISTMIMRIRKKPANRRFGTVGGVGTSLEIPKGLNLSSYEMVITYKLDGVERNIPIQSPNLAFPIRSAEREAEILKAHQLGGGR